MIQSNKFIYVTEYHKYSKITQWQLLTIKATYKRDFGETNSLNGLSTEKNYSQIIPR